MKITIGQLKEMLSEAYEPEGMSGIEAPPQPDLWLRLDEVFMNLLKAVSADRHALSNPEIVAAMDALEEVIDSLNE